MKTMNKTITWLLATVVFITFATTAEAQSAKQRTGKVVRIKGDARYSTGDRVWQPLKVGTILKSGTIVQTAKDSFADVIVSEEETASAVTLKPVSVATSPVAGGFAIPTPDQDVIRILDDSYLVFDSLTAVATGADTVTETLLDLKKGSIFGSVKKQAAASRFEIKIPNGVAGIRGTIFWITAAGSISCLTGSIIAAFTDSAGEVNTQPVGPRTQFNTVTGVSSILSEALLAYFNLLVNDSNYSSEHRGRGRGHGYGRDRDHGHDNVSNHRP